MKSLSARLLLLTVAFVMLGEVLIYVPSIARFRLKYLEQRVEEANLAALSLLNIPNFVASQEFERTVLQSIDAEGVVIEQQNSRILILADKMPPEVAASYDLRHYSVPALMMDAFTTLISRAPRIIRVVAEAKLHDDARIELILRETPLKQAMLDYSWNILRLSIIISLITAGLLYLSLQWLMVRPMRRITAAMTAFRKNPERTSPVPPPRQDEIGIAQRELANMQNELREALQQKTRLAELGAAVSKVNHDLRNILATAQLLSDHLVESTDPNVKRVTPRMIDAIDRAINLCARTLKYGSAAEPAPIRSEFPLHGLVDDVAAAVGLPADGRIDWQNRVATDLTVNADREQLFRVLLNLGRNAVQAVTGTGRITIAAEDLGATVALRVADTGSGLPDSTRSHLFEAFSGAGRSGGTGLGLAIARDLVLAHDGTIDLLKTGPDGTVFRVTLPKAARDQAAD